LIVIEPGAGAPPIDLPDAETGESIADPWRDGPVVLAFFKTTCPVCQMAAPKVQALAEGGVRVVAVGEDPPPAIESYVAAYGQKVPTVTEAPPYPASNAFGVDTVPTLFLIDEDGTVRDAVASWDRDGWNRLAAAAGAPPISDENDGLPPFRPG
jgi:thiol-disulfide isomerase/thioredoxin